MRYLIDAIILSICAVLFVFFLVGCMETDDSGYLQNDYDLVDDNTQLRLKFDGTDPVALNNYVNNWNWIQVCTGLSTYPAPLIVIVPDGHLYNSYVGYTWFEDGVIEIEESYAMDYEVIKHEMTHYLLLKNGEPDHLNASHESLLFDECSIPY